MDRASVWLHGIEKVYHKDDFEVIVNAQNFDLRNELKFQLVCGVCNIPAIFVSKKNGQKYFIYPKRSSKELAEKDKLCERRVNSVNPTQLKRYNQIIEQTTLCEISGNFFQLIGKLNKLDDEHIDAAVIGSRSKE